MHIYSSQFAPANVAPLGERGLKSNVEDFDAEIGEGRSPWGAWIEIRTAYFSLSCTIGRSPWGAWIEIHFHGPLILVR